MGKQTGRVTSLSLQGNDLIVIMESLWNSSYDWSAGKRDTAILGRTGWEDELRELPFMLEQLGRTELCLRLGQESFKSLGVKISVWTNTGATVSGYLLYIL